MIKNIKRNIVVASLLLSVGVFTLSCSDIKKEKPVGTIEKRAELPDIFPDYADVTVPVNIAPLNFRINGDVTSCFIEIKGDDGEELQMYGKDKVAFKQVDWERLKKENKGKSLSVTVSTKNSKGWTSWAPFQIHIAADSIDSHLIYRLIEPGYEKWHIIGIYQRNLESFDEKPIIKNDMTGYNCINCHTFCGGNPEQMMFHMRAANGATYLIQDNVIEKLNTKTENTISNLTYPYWHPSGKYIVASVNDVKQFFHSVKEKKMEVFDLKSDIVVYDIKNKTILSEASLLSDDAYETFPSFSADGKWLYFCSAPATEMPAKYDSIRYSLCRVPFDQELGKIGQLVDTLVVADTVSVSFPRISPDGRFLMYTETAYGQFPIWHKDAEVRMLDLQTLQQVDMSPINSDDTDSYHSWSSNSRWTVLSSRRENGLYTLPYISYINSEGQPTKPFLLPQEDPDMYDYFLYSFNLPELVKGEVSVSPYAIEQAAKQGKLEQVRFK